MTSSEPISRVTERSTAQSWPMQMCSVSNCSFSRTIAIVMRVPLNSKQLTQIPIQDTMQPFVHLHSSYISGKANFYLKPGKNVSCSQAWWSEVLGSDHCTTMCHLYEWSMGHGKTHGLGTNLLMCFSVLYLQVSNIPGPSPFSLYSLKIFPSKVLKYYLYI